jgi:hypothetical protein
LCPAGHKAKRSTKGKVPLRQTTLDQTNNSQKIKIAANSPHQ